MTKKIARIPRKLLIIPHKKDIPAQQAILAEVGNPPGPSKASEWTKNGDYEADGTCDY